MDSFGSREDGWQYDCRHSRTVTSRTEESYVVCVGRCALHQSKCEVDYFFFSATRNQMADKHYGLYRAYVLNNTDPELAFRLQLIAREVSDAPLSGRRLACLRAR